MTIDLFLDGVPVRQRSQALFEQVRGSILSGRVGPGDRLPATRHLAEELGVARSTVATVYARLVAEGYAEGRVGDGTFVSRTAGTIGDPPTAPNRTIRLHTTADRRLPHPMMSGDLDVIGRPPPDGWVADLRTGRPDPALFPIVEWRRCVTGTLHEPPPGYGDALGLPPLRRAIATWVARSRGVDATEDRVVVTAGAQGAFDLCARTLLEPGDVVAVEHPGYAPARAAFAAHGARIVPVRVDTEGIVVDDIPAEARVVVVTPSHQAPTGALMSADRRRQLLGAAISIGATIVEDDYDTEYRYVDRPLEPLHRLDGGGRTIYVGTFSKTLSPSLRLGFLVSPPGLVDALAATRRGIGEQPPHLTQAALSTFLTSGAFERHLRRTRRHYRSRRDLVVDRLADLTSRSLAASFAPCQAGLHTTVSLPADVSAEAVAAGLRGRGIAVSTTAADRLDGGPTDLVIGFGLTDLSQLDHAFRILTSALEAESSRPLGMGTAHRSRT